MRRATDGVGRSWKYKKFRYEPGTLVKSSEYYRRMRIFDLRAEGWTQEQVDADDRAAVTYAEDFFKQISLSQSRNQSEIDQVSRSGDTTGASTKGHVENGAVSQSQTSPARRANDASRKTRSGRITKKTPLRKSDTRRSSRLGKSTVRAEALPHNRKHELSKPEGAVKPEACREVARV